MELEFKENIDCDMMGFHPLPGRWDLVKYGLGNWNYPPPLPQLPLLHDPLDNVGSSLTFTRYHPTMPYPTVLASLEHYVRRRWIELTLFENVGYLWTAHGIFDNPNDTNRKLKRRISACVF